MSEQKLDAVLLEKIAKECAANDVMPENYGLIMFGSLTIPKDKMFRHQTWEEYGAGDAEPAENVEDLINAFLYFFPDAAWGVGHIVFEDHNLLDEHLDWCLNLKEDRAQLPHWKEPRCAYEQSMNLLRILRAIPEAERFALVPMCPEAQEQGKEEGE